MHSDTPSNENLLFSRERTIAKKQKSSFLYVKTNHVGSIHVIITDMKKWTDLNSNGVPDGGEYTADIVYAVDRYVMGGPMPGRSYFGAADNRYGYQGSEIDKEITGQPERNFTTLYREGDTYTGQWWTPDNQKPNASESPYAMMGRNPIWFNDVLGDTIRFEGRIAFKIAAKVQFAAASLFSKTAREQIKNLKESEHVFTVKEVSVKDIYSTGVTSNSWEVNDKNGIGAGAEIKFNFSLAGRKAYTQILGSDGGGKRHIFGRVVGHELKHANDIERGVIDRTRNAQGVKRSEAAAVKVENTVYKELKWFDRSINYRDNYGGLPVLDNLPSK